MSTELVNIIAIAVMAIVAMICITWIQTRSRR